MAGDAQAGFEPAMASAANFDETLGQYGLGALTRAKATTLQINVGKLCNQACHHCHVDAGPARTERMERATAERVLELLAHSPAIPHDRPYRRCAGSSTAISGCWSRAAVARGAR